MKFNDSKTFIKVATDVSLSLCYTTFISNYYFLIICQFTAGTVPVSEESVFTHIPFIF